MLCALTVRQLKPGAYDQFAESFGPAADEAPPAGWRRFTMLRDRSDPDRVVTFGHFDGTFEELEASQADQGYEEMRAKSDPYVEQVIVNGVFEVVREMDIAATPH